MRLGKLLRRLATVLALAAFFGAQTIVAADPPEVKTKVKAFLVGTDYYPNLKQLYGCSNDVDAFSAVLASWNVDLQQSVVLTSRHGDPAEKQVGKAEIEEGFKAFLDGLTSEDVAIVMLTGHGCQIRDESGDWRTYYAPSEAHFDSEGKNLVVDSLVDLSKMIDQLSMSKAKFKWMIVDACRDTKNDKGTTRDLAVNQRELKPFEVNVADTTSGKRENFYLSQSCAAQQKSKEWQVKESGIARGAYMLSLCEALEDEQKAELEGNARVVSIVDACERAKAIVKKYIPDNTDQTPTNTQFQDSSTKSIRSAKIADVDVDFVWIPQGEFAMGSSKGSRPNEGQPINVKITRGYWLARTETTNELWSQVMGEELEEGLDPQKPVVGKTWDECKRFVDKLNENKEFLRQFSPGESAAVFEASLPTEAQWERACRAGQKDEVTREIASGIREVGTTESDVNPWNLCDMFGNAREWTLDYYEDYAESTFSDLNDRCCERNTGLRVVRGAPAASTSGVARATQREGVYLDETAADVGFRIALVRKNP